MDANSYVQGEIEKAQKKQAEKQEAGLEKNNTKDSIAAGENIWPKIANDRV